MSLTFETAVRRAWRRETAVAPDLWSPAVPETGQCAVTALCVQDEYGGDLLRCMVDGNSHYFNRLPSGRTLDLTKSQFSADAEWTQAELRPRSYLLESAGTTWRYDLLRGRIRP